MPICTDEWHAYINWTIYMREVYGLNWGELVRLKSPKVKSLDLYILSQREIAMKQAEIEFRKQVRRSAGLL